MVERKSLRAKTPIHLNLTITQYRLFFKRIQKIEIQTFLLLLGYDGGWSLLFFSHWHKASFSFSLATLCCQEERKLNLLLVAPQITCNSLNFLSCFDCSEPKRNLGSFSLFQCGVVLCPTNKGLNLAFI
jgi:hypothetical protein